MPSLILSIGYKRKNHVKTLQIFRRQKRILGTVEDIDKRHELEEKMNEALGWTGLGACDGSSIGKEQWKFVILLWTLSLQKM